MRTHLIRGVALAAAAATLAACSDTANVLVPKPPANAPIMERYVALGNSITAGFQSGGINDSTQRESYAYLLAKAAGTNFVYASLPPGCAPPLTALAGPPVNAPGACGLTKAYPFVNNVAVPGAFAADAISPYAAAPVALTSLLIGGKSEVRRALDANPTFMTVWLGNNEVLAPASVGVLTPVPGASAGLIPSKTIIGNIRSAVDSLRMLAPIRGGVLIGVVNVVNAPRLFPGSALVDATGAPTPFALTIDQFTGQTVFFHPNCIGTDAMISTVIVEQIKAGAYPPIIACAPTTITGVPASAKLGDLFVLSATEQQALGGVVSDVNAFLKAKADSVGFAYFDPNTALVALKQAGAIPALPDFTNPVAPFGPYMSTDGVHPRKPTHVALANALAQLINQKYGTTIPAITAP